MAQNMVKLQDRMVTPGDYRKLHQLFMSVGMEGVPADFEEFRVLAPRIYYHGIFNGPELVACLGLYFDMRHPGGLGFEASCYPEWKTYWATPRLFKKIFDIAFNHFNATYLFAETNKDNVQRALVTLGFTKLLSSSDNVFTYVLNNYNVKPRLRA